MFEFLALFVKFIVVASYLVRSISSLSYMHGHMMHFPYVSFLFFFQDLLKQRLVSTENVLSGSTIYTKKSSSAYSVLVSKVNKMLYAYAVISLLHFHGPRGRWLCRGLDKFLL